MHYKALFFLFSVLFNFYPVYADNLPHLNNNWPKEVQKHFQEHRAPITIIPLQKYDKKLPHLSLNNPLFLEDIPVNFDSKYVYKKDININKQLNHPILFSGNFIIDKDTLLKIDNHIREKWYNRNLFYHIDYEIEFSPGLLVYARKQIENERRTFLDHIKTELNKGIEQGLFKWDQKAQRYVPPNKKTLKDQTLGSNTPWRYANHILEQAKMKAQGMDTIVLGYINIQFNGEEAPGVMFMLNSRKNKIIAFDFKNMFKFHVLEQIGDNKFRGKFENAWRVRIIGKNTVNIYFVMPSAQSPNIGKVSIDPKKSYLMLLDNKLAARYGGVVPLAPGNSLLYLR